MIVGIVVAVPFMARRVCLPVLFRLHIPKTSISKPEQARAMVDLLAQTLPAWPGGPDGLGARRRARFRATGGSHDAGGTAARRGLTGSRHPERAR
ncbi:hypothetical protein FF86_105833 [Frankia sp. CpI1-P]|uniref:hypothetical protein n=1 Tax=unclassified Frankia TaxID=2632575 RepID=UPI0006F32415|nr:MULTISPECIES: hypothetical protein [unclassified Frankia]KQM02708.1 hypothetical protein FF86_105833 [Frankia sp. CpI1-P]